MTTEFKNVRLSGSSVVPRADAGPSLHDKLMALGRGVPDSAWAEAFAADCKRLLREARTAIENMPASARLDFAAELMVGYCRGCGRSFQSGRERCECDGEPLPEKTWICEHCGTQWAHTAEGWAGMGGAFQTGTSKKYRSWRSNRAKFCVASWCSENCAVSGGARG